MTPGELEWRRRRAVELVGRGERRADVARILGVHPKTLDRWVRLARRPGDGLAARPRPGPAPGLGPGPLKELDALLAAGGRWTVGRVADLIAERFGRRYHPETVRKLLRRLGWTARRLKRHRR